MSYSNDELINKFVPSRRQVQPLQRPAEQPFQRQQSPKTANTVNPALVVGIVGLMLVIPLALFGLNWWRSKPAARSTATKASPSPSTIVESSPIVSPSSAIEPSVAPAASPKPTPKATVKPSPKPSVSPTASASPTTTGSTDLSVDDITVEDAQNGSSVSSPYYAGQRVTLRAKLRNNGKSETPIFSSSWSVNGSTVCSNSTGKVKAETQATYDDVNSLTCTIWLKLGDNSFTYTVDSANSLKEANTSNNTRNKTLTTQGTRTDLEAVSIQLYQQGTTTAVGSPTVGQKLTARATFKNSGQEKQNNFSLRWLYNTSEVKKTQVSSWLTPGSTVEETVGYDFTVATGSATVRFELNNDAVFPETNTGNNGYTKTLNL